jgi:hypothetical protein
MNEGKLELNGVTEEKRKEVEREGGNEYRNAK